MSLDQLITGGGTVGLIAVLLYIVERFSSGKWRPGSEVDKADARTERALEAGHQATAAVNGLSDRLDKALAIIEAQRGVR